MLLAGGVRGRRQKPDVERQVRYLLRHAGVDADLAAADSGVLGVGPPPAAASPEIVALVSDGKLIQAITVYRQMTGMGLKESKDAIDALRADVGLVRRR